MKKNIWLNNKLNTEILLSYKEAKREVSKEIRNSRAMYYHNELHINKHNNRNTWNIKNDLTKGANHKILLNKLIKYNVDTFWFSSYFDNRTQSIKAGSQISEPLPITFGVPQGSILGAILFNILLMIYLISMKTLKEHLIQMTYKLLYQIPFITYLT